MQGILPCKFINIMRESKKPLIAVIDTGISADVSYRESIIGGVSFFIENHTIYMDTEYDDRIGHGTCVCSMIRRRCPNATFYIVKIYENMLITSSFLLLQALEHLLEIPVNFINLSLSVNSNLNTEQIRDVLYRLYKQGKIVIVSVKNRMEESFPANCEFCYGVKGVSDLNENAYFYQKQDNIQLKTNGSPEYVESINGRKEWFYGNSKAAAGASGLLAEIYSKYSKIAPMNSMDLMNAWLQKAGLQGEQDMKDDFSVCGAPPTVRRSVRMENIAKLIDVCRNYGNGDNVIKALKNVNVEIRRGEFIAVVGASGSGKSTLLNILGGLDVPTSGIVMIDGKELGGMNDERLTVFRRENIGFVFQNFNLIPMLTAYENIVLPIQIGGNDVDTEYVGNIIGFLGLTGLENRMPSQLSGGQQQRVAIARALASKPAIILADEPTGSLDSEAGRDVVELFASLVKEFHQTVVMVTHNESLADRCDRILVMKDGVLAEAEDA